MRRTRDNNLRFSDLASVIMEEMTDLFARLISQNDSLDMAESEFRRMLVDEPELRRQYREYCREVGTSERNGFKDFCDEYMQKQDDVWNTLSDYDNRE